MDGPRNGLSEIAKHLASVTFPSKAAVEIDSILVSSLFGQRTKKEGKKVHNIQDLVLSTACIVDDETRDCIYSTFQENKDKLCFQSPQTYLACANQVAKYIHEGSRLLESQGVGSLAIIEWCIAAYSMVINPESCVKLSCVRRGVENTLGFAIHAVTQIKSQQIIYELVGLKPEDRKAENSQVLDIKPSPKPNQPTDVKRVTFGPIRFINHICSTPNAEYVAVEETSGFYVMALRDIAPGEELLINHGEGWFADKPGGCPCLTCKPEQKLNKLKRPAEEKDEATIQAEKKACRSAKRRRTRERKKKWKALEASGMAGPSGI